MMNKEYDEFTKALNELACCYCRALEGGEIAAYFKQLARYPLDLVTKATAAAPERYPTFFPSVGQLIEICDSISAQERPTVDTVTLLRGVNECEHEDRFEPEPEGGLYAGFLVCGRCGRAKPVLNQAAPPVQLDYFRMAVNPKGRDE
ncbi:MAG TPA: hypothetical protein VJZ77_09340 [Blastocatellia bacterium]|nr:hypothetical protein [Blastocatellia bacterium]